jgi:hypothetical protein
MLFKEYFAMIIETILSDRIRRVFPREREARKKNTALLRVKRKIHPEYIGAGCMRLLAPVAMPSPRSPTAGAGSPTG